MSEAKEYFISKKEFALLDSIVEIQSNFVVVHDIPSRHIVFNHDLQHCALGIKVMHEFICMGDVIFPDTPMIATVPIQLIDSAVRFTLIDANNLALKFIPGPLARLQVVQLSTTAVNIRWRPDGLEIMWRDYDAKITTREC